jgi:glycerophosphoryl diester phosphodiesterase
MDIQLTKDKRPVVCHDINLQRLCGVDKNVSDLNYDELPRIQSTIDLHFSSLQYTSDISDSMIIPLLEDVMEAFPKAAFNMELKNDDQELKVEVLRLIRKYKRESLTIWGNVKEQQNLIMKAMAPDIANFAPIEVITRIMIYYLIGFLPFYNIPYDTFQFPYVNEDYVNFKNKQSGKTLRQWLYIKSLEIYHFFGLLIFWHLRRRNIYVFLYAINNEDDIDIAMGKSIDGIITDTPQLLVNHILKKET